MEWLKLYKTTILHKIYLHGECFGPIKKNGTYKFTAKSEDGKTGELEIQTNFEEGTFKFDLEDVGVKEYTFIKGLTWEQLVSGTVNSSRGEIIMPDGLKIWISQDNVHGITYNGMNYYFAFIDDDLIIDGNTYTATKKNNN